MAGPRSLPRVAGRGEESKEVENSWGEGSLKPSTRVLQNFLFTSKEENASLKDIDFGMSDFVKPG
ncbi:hypothetical protein Taro_000060 [Colocasia esculenta]|uniref:Uncharacterized protein n=1 Tax=Colocasia esculenta TaxID=4460 RepID=A0A843TFL3_COLES|nr:hypothetical protein [Colocasia esculenta]